MLFISWIAALAVTASHKAPRRRKWRSSWSICGCWCSRNTLRNPCIGVLSLLYWLQTTTTNTTTIRLPPLQLALHRSQLCNVLQVWRVSGLRLEVVGYGSVVLVLVPLLILLIIIIIILILTSIHYRRTIGKLTLLVSIFWVKVPRAIVELAGTAWLIDILAVAIILCKFESTA